MTAARRSGSALVVVGMIACSAGCADEDAGEDASVADAVATELASPELDSPEGARARWGRLPLRYEENRGQHDARVRYLARQGGLTMFLTDEGPVLALRVPVAGSSGVTSDDAIVGHPAQLERRDEVRYETALLRLRVEGADPDARLEARRELVTRTNYFIGNDPSRWRTDVPNFGEVAYREIRPGVDLVLHGSLEGRVEYDFVVAPGAATDVMISFEGADEVRLAEDGALEIRSGEVVLRQPAPVLYQEVDGRRVAVAGSYRLAGGASVGFEVGAYDASRPLVIDPVLVYSTYLGGWSSDLPLGVAVDAAGAAYVVGNSLSMDFPTARALQPSNGGGLDAFIAKLTPAGDALIYATYLGGSNIDSARSVTVDAAGAAYVVGQTRSTDFPTAGALQPSHGGEIDAFVAKLAPSGDALTYATYLGDWSLDSALSVAVDAAGAAYVVGETYSPNFPTAEALQPTLGGLVDAFVAKLTPSGDALVYATFLGGSGNEIASGVAVDAMGAAFVVGGTSSGLGASTSFPTVRALQPSDGGSSDAFVAKLTPGGDALAYATYLGGSDSDTASDVALDATGAAYVVGATHSPNFPTARALQPSSAGRGDVFIAKLTPAGDALAFATYLGGSGEELVLGVAVDAAGAAYLVGLTQSTDFPTAVALQPGHGGGMYDAFVAMLTPSGDALAYATYWGGSGNDRAVDVAVDAAGAAYVVGDTVSTNFPTAPGALQSAYGGMADGFLTKLALTEQGGPCSAAAQCQTGHCTDGVCCDSACTGQCEACDVTGLIGECSSATGAPHGARGACGTDGSACGGMCDGETRDACAYPGEDASCGEASCEAGMATTARACDGAGSCHDGATTSCSPYACGEGACLPSCAADGECTAGFVCVAGVCQEPIVPDAGASIDAGTSADAGANIDAGTSADAGEPPVADGGCGCRAGGVSSDRASGLVGLLFMLGRLFRRRRSADLGALQGTRPAPLDGLGGAEAGGTRAVPP